jgi:hypothetical protein
MLSNSPWMHFLRLCSKWHHLLSTSSNIHTPLYHTKIAPICGYYVRSSVYTFSESLGCQLTENFEEFKNSSLFFQIFVKHSNKVWQPTCLETNFILIPNFQQISTKYAPKNRKRTIFHKFKQFWWIWSFMPMSNYILIHFYL